jgi:hypothetical protein
LGFMQKRVSGKLVAIRAVIWCVFAMVWIWLSFGRVRGLQAAGQPVGALTWAVLAFWIAVLVFWFVMGVRAYRGMKQRAAMMDEG